MVVRYVATTQDNLDDKLRKFEIRDMMGLTDDRDISETVSETWSTDVLGSDFDPNMDEDRLQEIAGMSVFLQISVVASHKAKTLKCTSSYRSYKVHITINSNVFSLFILSLTFNYKVDFELGFIIFCLRFKCKLHFFFFLQ